MLLLMLGLLSSALAVAETAPPCPIERAAAAGQHVWLLCQQGELYVSADEGRTWQVKRLQAETRLRAMAFLDSRRGFVAGDGGLLLATTDGGETWHQVAVPTRENLTSICFVGEKVWVSGWTGTILHSSDGGRTWAQQPTGVLQGLDCVHFVDENHGWAVGWVGTILRTTDGGRTWERARTPAALWSLLSVYFRNASDGWAVGFNGQILRSRDGGRTWERQSSPVQALLSSVMVDASGRGWITTDTQLLETEDEGETWKAVPVEGTPCLHQLLPLGSGLWAVGRFGILAQLGSSREFRNLATLPKATVS